MRKGTDACGDVLCKTSAMRQVWCKPRLARDFATRVFEHARDVTNPILLSP